MRTSRPGNRAIAVAAVVATAVLVTFASMVLGKWFDHATLEAVDDVTLAVLAAFVTVLLARAAVAATGRIRAAWTLLAVSIGAFAIGEFIWCYYELVLHEAPFPSPADVFYLIFPVMACAGLLLFRNRRPGASEGRIVLDGLIVAGSLFIVSWTLVMQGIYEAGAASGLEFALLITYPLSDLVILTVAAVVLVGAKSGQRITMTLVTLGLAGMAVADGGYAYLSAQEDYLSGDIVDIGWVAGLLLIALGAMVGRRATLEVQPGDEVPGWTSVWLPYLPLMLAAVVLAWRPPAHLASGPVLPVGMLLVVTVLARQFLAVSEDRRLVRTIADQAFRDPLTGLDNWARFKDRLDQAIRQRARHGQGVGVLALDLNYFKLVNDAFGHGVGDELLRAVAGRLASAADPADTVARLGGDEFAVLMRGTADGIRRRADAVVASFDQPFPVDGNDLLIRPSAGLAVGPGAGRPSSGDQLLKQADTAMYAGKRSGFGGVQVFTAELALVPNAAQELFARASAPTVDDGPMAVRLLAELRDAIGQGALDLVYQPKFDLAGLQIVGVEALLRWNHPQRGRLGPDDFLPLIRQHGLMAPVTDFVVNRALDDAVRWRSAAPDVRIPVAVNLFAPSVSDLELPDRLAAALADRGLDAAILTVEITEDLFLDSMKGARTVLNRLRKAGIRVAVDDFGSGYSALSYLWDLPIDEVKLDRGFIAQITVDPRAAAVVRAVIELARVLLLTTVAEGVEDRRTAEILRSYGCDVVQGFHYSPPVEADEVPAMVTRSQPCAGTSLSEIELMQ